MESSIPTQLGPYRLLDRLGSGGMGEVWRAEDTDLLRQVAIKFLPHQLAADPEWKARFLREARTVAKLNHPGIATIYAVAEHESLMYIAMELVEGESLTAVIARGLAQREAVRIISDIALALAEAHEHGIIHRDIKPDNMIVGKRGVKVLDFGIAKQIGPGNRGALTQADMIIGTPQYMSPEQALGKQLDARSDIFSLGVVLYEALMQKRPFEGESLTDTLVQLVTLPHAPLTGVPQALAKIVERCLYKKPEQRYGTMGELAAALVQVKLDAAPTVMLEKTPPPAPPKPPRATISTRVLIADDDELARVALTAVLENDGVKVDEVTNGADCIRHLKQQQYSTLFIDLLMPRMDGWSVLDFLRKTEQRPERVFVVTGVRDAKLSVVDRDVVTALIRKPINPAELARMVK